MKFIIPSSILLLLSSLSLCADEVSQMQPQGPEPRDPCCPAPLPCCPVRPDCIPPRCAQLVGGPKGEITPNAGPCVACGMDLFLTADFIYWTVREDNLQYASTTGTDAASPVKGKVFFPDFKMEPGFKVGAGILFDHDGWDVFAEYTWIRARDIKGHATPSTGTVLMSSLGLSAMSPSIITSASVNWELHYFNVIDLEMGRNFYVSRYLKLRPHFGFKGTWQKQFYNSSLQQTASGSVFNTTLTEKQFFWGFGIRAGLDAAWHFSRSFSTFGEISVSGLYGQFEDNFLVLTNNGAGAFITSDAAPINRGSSFHTIKPVIEWMIGLRWEMYTCDKEFHFALEAGWEEQYWLGQNQFTDSGDLIMQGLTTKFRFDF